MKFACDDQNGWNGLQGQSPIKGFEKSYAKLRERVKIQRRGKMGIQ